MLEYFYSSVPHPSHLCNCRASALAAHTISLLLYLLAFLCDRFKSYNQILFLRHSLLIQHRFILFTTHLFLEKFLVSLSFRLLFHSNLNMSKVHVVTDQQRKTVVEEYKDFFHDRQKKKRSQYLAVFYIGMFFILLGGIFSGGSGQDSNHRSLQELLYIIGNAAFDLGIVIITLVATDVINVDNEMILNQYVRFLLALIPCLLGVIYGVTEAGAPPYFPGFLLLLLGLSALPHMCNCWGEWNDENYIRLSGMSALLSTTAAKIALSIPLIYFSWTISYCWLAIDPVDFGDKCIDLTNSVYCGDDYVSEVPSMSERRNRRGLFAILSFFLLLFTLVAIVVFRSTSLKISELMKKAREEDDIGKNIIKNYIHMIATDLLYKELYLWMGGEGILRLILAIGGFAYQTQLFYSHRTYFLTGLYNIIFLTLVLAYGRERWFFILARYFELDMATLQDDGAWMAEMAAKSGDLNNSHEESLLSSPQIDESKKGIGCDTTRWIYRKQQANYDNYPDCVERKFWMRGDIVDLQEMLCCGCMAITTRQSTVRVNMWEDLSTWNMKYNEVRLERLYNGKLMDEVEDWKKYCLAQGNSIQKMLESQFDDWANANFSITSQIKEISRNKDGCYVELKLTDIVNKRGRHELLGWAKMNLRQYNLNTNNLDELQELLDTSPRFLDDNVKKEAAFKKSEHIEVRDESDKINYFMSHSWSDEQYSKVEAIGEFVGRLKNKQIKKSSGISLWFDKVCIDQKSPGDTLAVLPINIGFCDKLLILMGDTYMERLWCVWELFTLFIFCQKEVAIERMEILPLQKQNKTAKFSMLAGYMALQKKLRSKDILEHAHCFDPNEELKLRRILYSIGSQKLEEIKDEIKGVIEKKVKLYRREKFVEDNLVQPISPLSHMSDSSVQHHSLSPSAKILQNSDVVRVFNSFDVEENQSHSGP